MNDIRKAISLIIHIGGLPRVWPVVCRKLIGRFKVASGMIDLEQEHRESENWCERHAVDSAGAVKKMNYPTELVRFKDKLASIYADSCERVATCPVKMGGAANLDLLYTVCESINAQRVIETGVAYGWSSLAILSSLKNRNNARLFSIDLPYLRFRGENLVGIGVPDYLRDNWVLMRTSDRKGIPKAIKMAGAVDMAHYDSDKSPEGRQFAYPLLWSALRHGGVLISDDVSDDMVFIKFSEGLGINPIIVRYDNKFAGILIKA